MVINHAYNLRKRSKISHRHKSRRISIPTEYFKLFGKTGALAITFEIITVINTPSGRHENQSADTLSRPETDGVDTTYLYF